MDMPSKDQLRHCGILKSRGLMSGDSLSGSKPRMHGFDAVWWNSCSRFKHCAMAPEHQARMMRHAIDGTCHERHCRMASIDRPK
jgi:hypothetical protein